MMKWLFLVSIFLSACVSPSRVYNPPLRMVVKDKVVNVRAQKIPHVGRYEYDELQETQVEEGEPVLVHEILDGWARVEVPEQIEFTHNSKWEGYPGWVPYSSLTKDLSKHHTLRKKNQAEEEVREEVLRQAHRHLGNAYLWGGRSLYDERNLQTLTGVDCSGLVNWSFRQLGWFVPRDAHEQYMRARALRPRDLKPGDLIFLAKKSNPKKIVHVAFYTGKGEILEAPFTGEKVRHVSIQDRFGISFEELAKSQETEKYIFKFGTFFN